MYEGYQSSNGALDASYDAACGGGISAPSCGTFINSVIGTYATEQQQRKDNAIANAMYTAHRVFDADKISSFAMIRSKDVKSSQNVIQDATIGDVAKVNHDVDLTRRQFEINEYHYHNKLDTLFFLQVFFIAVLIMVLLMYFNRRGFLTTAMTGLLTGILAIVVLLIAVTRYFYTIRTRDRRLWHRRYFQTERDPAPDTNRCPGTSANETTIDLNSFFSKKQINCAVDTANEYNAWFTSVNNEATSYMQGEGIGGPSSSLFTVPDSCKRR